MIQRMRMSVVVGVAALSVAVGIGMVATPVFAATDCGGVETSIIGGDACDGASVNSNDSADSPVISVLTFVMKIMVGAVGVAAVGALIYAGILYSAAGGEAGQVQKAKTVIRDTVIGIVCFAGMIIILNFVIPGGVFGQTGTTGGGTKATASTSSGSSSGNSSVASFDNIDNFRDAATSSNSKVLKSGILYRSANLNKASGDDVKELSTLLAGGVIIDLRKSSDDGYKKDPTPDNVDNVHIPITGKASAAGYKKTFVDSASDRQQFGKAIKEIANSKGPVLIHCKAGKDRTGWTVAMVMYIVGDSKYDQSTLDGLVMDEYLKSPNVDKSWLNAGLSEAQDKYHSIMGYIKNGLGVSDTTIAALKKRLGT